jgi:hypothetical protein
MNIESSIGQLINTAKGELGDVKHLDMNTFMNNARGELGDAIGR